MSKTKATIAPVERIVVGDRVTVPPLPGMPGLPGVWLVEQEQWCGSTRYLLVARHGAPGWHAVDAARCVLATGKGKGRQSA